MNCAEAVKRYTYSVEAPRKPVPNTKSGNEFAHAIEKEQGEEEKKKGIYFDPRRSARIRGQVCLGQNKCGRASHPTASFVDSCLPCHRLATE
jgi:hypothetical protein